MSIVALFLNLLLAGLLIAAVTIGVRLERRLKGVREGQLEFARAVADLDRSAIRAKEGLAELRAATDEATDVLGGRISRAREASERLEALVRRADGMTAAASAVQTPPPAGPEGGLAALLRRIKDAEGQPATAATPPARPPALAERPLRLKRSADDDLFEDAGGRA